MFGLSPIIAQSVAEAKTKGGDYRLYLLPDNSSASLATVQRKVNGGNAVLLYPNPSDKGRSESQTFKACFIQNGDLRVYPDSKKLEEVFMGEQKAIHVTGAVPCDITATQPNGANLIKAALARAGFNLRGNLSLQYRIVLCVQTSSPECRSRPHWMLLQEVQYFRINSLDLS